MEEKQTTPLPAWKMLTPIWLETHLLLMKMVKYLHVKVATRVMSMQTDLVFTPNCGAKRDLSKQEVTAHLKAQDLKISLLENVADVTQLVANAMFQDQIVLVVGSLKSALTTHTASVLHQT